MARPATQPAEIHIRPVLRSPTFDRAPKLRSLLEWLWEHRDEEITEYRIAVEALQQRPDFDPAIDATVRVQISRLRQRLREYHEREGDSGPVRLSIPMGRHHLEWELVAQPDTGEPEAAEAAPAAPVEPTSRTNRRSLAAGILGLGALAAAVIVLRPWDAAGPQPGRSLPPFWQRFIQNGKPLKVMLVHIRFYRWPNGGAIITDPAMGGDTADARAGIIGRLSREFGPPQLYQSLTRKIDTFAAIDLVRNFSSRGIAVSVEDNTGVLDNLGDHNVVVLGSVNALFREKFFTDCTGFRNLPRTEGFADPRRELQGREVYERKILNSRMKTVPGLMALLPPHPLGGNRLVLTGEHTAGLASALFSPTALQALEAFWRRKGAPAAYEVLFEQDADGLELIASKPLLLREIVRK